MSDLTSLFGDFLRALCDPAGGGELYRLHAADSLIRHAQGIGAAAGVEPEAFAQAHRERSEQGRHYLPHFVDPVLLQGPTADPQLNDAVTWFRVTEKGASLSLIAALGTRAVANETKVGWCTLTSRLEPWSYRQGLVQSLADYPWTRRAEPAASRALLDASYFRLHWRAPVRFVSLPDNRFSCQMSSACCRHDYEITVPPEAQLLIDAIPWGGSMKHLANTRLPIRPDGTRQLKGPHDTCRFLSPSNLCAIHQALGRQPFAACCVFPFSFARTPVGIAVGLSPICGSTRLGLGIPIEAREDDLRERLIHVDPRSTDVFRLGPDVQVSWENFQIVEKALCDCLAAGDLPMRRRLYVGAKTLWAVRNGQPIQPDAWIAEPLTPLLPDLREAIRAMLTRILAWDRAVLRALPRELPSDLHRREVNDALVVTRILQNTLFCKVYSYPFDLTSAHNFLIVLYLLALTMQAAQDGPLPDVMWRELGSLGVHGLLKSLLHEGAPSDFRTLFGTPEFGMWMLAA